MKALAAIGAFLKRPAVSHTIAVLLTAAASYLASGKVDVSSVLQGLGSSAPAASPAQK